MGSEITKFNQDEFASENSLVKSALQAPKVIHALPHEIDGAISVAVDKAIFYLGLKTDENDRDAIKITAIDDVKRHFKLLTVDELGIAIDNGVHGKYGAVVGLSPKDVYNWINAYSISTERRENQERLQKEQSEVKEPTEEEKEKLRWDNMVNAFALFKDKGTFNDFGNAVYNYLDKKEKINFSVEQKEDFMRMALINLKNQLNPLQHVGNMIKAGEFKAILNEIIEQPKSIRVVSEAKKCALIHLFKELNDLEMSIEDLFITE